MHQRFTESVFLPHPLLQNDPKISIINCFDAD